ncbi:MAG: DUF2277 domain-containing protein [Polyangiaceae bacterium]
MCRNIRVLHHFEPPTTEEEIRDAALQYVRKISGTRAPSKKNQEIFERAIQLVTEATRELVFGLETHGPPRTREGEREKAKLRTERRFGPRS